MKQQNLKTVSITRRPNTFSLNTFPGWFVVQIGNRAKVEGLGSVLNSPHITTAPNKAWLMAASLQWKDIEREFMPVEDNPYDYSYIVKDKVLLILPEADDKFYFRIFLPEGMTISKDFDIILDTHIEDPCWEGKFNRMVCASLPKDLPLTVDTRGTLCVSPI